MSDHNHPGGTDGLLGDLESIRTLLEESERHAQSGSPASARPADPAPQSDEDVPLLEDVVRGGVGLHESYLTGEQDFIDESAASGLDDDIFKALLSDEWRESARDLLDQARAAIEQHPSTWTPAHTDELNEALKVRIDQTLQLWLREAVASRMDELRQELLAAVSQQIATTIDQQFNQTSPNEEPDGE